MSGIISDRISTDRWRRFYIQARKELGDDVQFLILAIRADELCDEDDRDRIDSVAGLFTKEEFEENGEDTSGAG